MFIGREKELTLLKEDLTSPRSEFCVIYGRRRIGKTTLLKKFTEGTDFFYFQAGKESKSQHLRRFSLELGQNIGDILTSKTRLNHWDEALILLDRSLDNIVNNAINKKAIVVFDEFQWMCNGSPELLSDIQRYWDDKWQNRGNIFFILCGSSISFMLGEVLSRKSPLFGRRTRSIHLYPFKIADAIKFLPGKNLFEATEYYMVSGGIPTYLKLFGTPGSFKRIIAKHALNSSGFLFDEVKFILSEQLKEQEHYFRVLREMSQGSIEIAELSRRTNINTGQITYYMERLQLLGFVRRHSPINESTRSKRVRYLLSDYYLRFYFSFIHENREKIEHTENEMSFDELIGTRWPVYLGLTFERFVSDHANFITKKAGFENKFVKMGSYWQKPTKRKKGV